MARFNDKELPFHFDGRKCFFEIAPISQEEIDTLPKDYLNTWENVPFEPSTRTNTSRAVSTVKNPYLAPWKHCLGFVPDSIVHKTLQVTTQMVPTVKAETREHMCDHIVTCLPELKHRRVPDTVCCDTFFSSITSVRGFNCWIQYSFVKSGLDKVYLMRRHSQALPTLQKLVAECGIPHTIHSDNAPEFKSDNWNKFLRKYLISSYFTEPHHPNQNTCERRGGVLKSATVHLLTVTAAPLIYWCYALEYVCLLQSVLAHRNLDWTVPTLYIMGIHQT